MKASRRSVDNTVIMWSTTYPLQNDMWHGGVGVDDDSGRLVIPDLLQQRGGILAVVEHAHRQGLLGDEELPEELLQVQ